MKLRNIVIVLSVLVLSALAPLVVPAAQAMCPATDDLTCQWWGPAQQKLVNQHAFLHGRIGEARDGMNIGACDAACVDAYDKTGDRLLSRFAKFNNLPVDLVVKAYIVTWDQRGAAADKLLGAGKWDVQDTGQWLNDFADELRVNHPYFILGERRYCVVADLGGYCPGLW